MTGSPKEPSGQAQRPPYATDDQGCRLCYAQPSEACTSASGRRREDHQVRVLEREAARKFWSEHGYPCRSGHKDCTVDCGWCKGTGYERPRPQQPSASAGSTEVES